ncbi:MAG: 1-deoxy-D-xylulose-5-phosphate synthase [Lachnospiraceae bacterium]|nr:1-deoxy-D-xylulose-5-phosphate synthase [Lachnospiraceae bacterium]
MVLDNIRMPGDIQKLDPELYPELAREIRDFLLLKVSENGGHLASNLGVVELTMALHLAFSPPEDKIIWDVGHQSYTHKILTGRKDAFDGLRRFGGLSGFPKLRESSCDVYETGHSSTSLSAGIGLVQARELLGGDYGVVAVIGDGSLSGGMAYEALNNASRVHSNFIIVLNDNNMSISESTGGISTYLSRIRMAKGYNELKQDVANKLQKVPGIGGSLVETISRTKSSIKQLVIPGMLFENLDITYVGPIDGHNIPQMVRIFKEARQINRPILVHVLTQKGRGYEPAERRPSFFHGVSPFEPATGRPKKEKTAPTYTDVFARTICRLAAEQDRLVAITAAMADGTGLKRFASMYPERFYDVGIAEEHAVSFAAGLAVGGLKPVVAVYSTFLQRAYDQILLDVCLQKLPVIFAVDRAGLVGNDGETHQGVFDLSYLSQMPGMTILAPKNSGELKAALEFAVSFEGPIAVRYPRGTAYRGLKECRDPMVLGKSEVLKEGRFLVLLAVGSMVKTAAGVCERLLEEGICATFVNVRFVKPMDTELLDRLAGSHTLFVTLEDNVLRGGYGEAVTAYMHEAHRECRVLNLGVPDFFVEQGDTDVLYQALKLDERSVFRRIKEACAGEINT